MARCWLLSRYIVGMAVSAFLTVAFSQPSEGAAFFEDGFLGLTPQEVHAKLGTPHAIRSRKAALRVFHYYSFQDWEKYFKKLVSPENGEDVYTYHRNGYQVRYSFVYTPDLREEKEFPTLYVKRVEIEFSPAAPLKDIPNLVPEFRPPTAPDAPVFRSNLWILIFKGAPSREAELIVKERDKEKWEWSLAYQLFAINGIPDYLTLDTPIDRLELTAQSLPLIRQLRKLTHEPILNPYSQEFANLPPPPPKPKKPIPVPQYAD
ncbi:MAG: hypothetical protein D6704_04040 [Nitrospirae bacterium]|nr:MAG: hypothetical protein D6704_04040 [Nitrospirota bacterium]